MTTPEPTCDRSGGVAQQRPGGGMTRPSRLRRASVAGLGAFLLVAGVSACGSGNAGSAVRRVAPPGPNSSPREVVHIYVAALNEHDKSTVDAVTDDDGTAERWLNRVKRVDRLKITSVLDENPTTAGFSKGTELRDVAVTFSVSWNQMDPSVGSGDTDWGYLLKKSSTTGWTIVDQGTG